jgi:uncharacterized protein (DUF1778 family)
MRASTLQTKPLRPNVHARVPDEIKQRWQNAAAMRGQTLTDFIIVAANAATDKIFEQEEKIKLSERDQLKLAEMLLNPPAINEPMKDILTKYRT